MEKIMGKERIPDVSPEGHHHNQIVTYIHPESGFTATFQWDGIRQVYDPLQHNDAGLKSLKNILPTQAVDKV